MPELPDVEVFTRNLNKLFAGKKLLRIKVAAAKNISTKSLLFSKRLKGKKLIRVFRSGKEMRFEFSDGVLLGLHLMLTGDVHLLSENKIFKSTLAELTFEDGSGFLLTDRMKNAFIQLDPEDKEGIDAISPQLNFKFLKQALQRKAKIKNVLTDQHVIRGIGNSYSDEILWATRISPYSIANAIPDEKIKELAAAIKSRLKKEIKQIEKAQNGKVSGEIKDFMLIHHPKKTHSPTGAKIIVDKNGMMKTYYTKEQVLYK